MSRTDWRSKVQQIDWPSISLNPDGAVRARDLLLRVWNPNLSQQAALEIYAHLDEILVNQGSVDEISIAAARLLIGLVGDDAAPWRHLAVQSLRDIAVPDQEAWLNDRPSIAVMRSEVQRLTGLSPQAVQNERATWAEAAEDDGQRRYRQLELEAISPEIFVWTRRMPVEAYDVVRSGVPSFIQALQSDDNRLAIWVPCLLAWFPEEREIIVPALLAACEKWQFTNIQANIAVALGMVAAKDDPVVVPVLQKLRRFKDSRVRWSATLGLGELLSAPDRQLVADLHECMWNAGDELRYWDYLSGDMELFASKTIGALPPSAAAARVEVVLNRLQEPADDDWQFGMAHLLLEATIGATRSLHGRGFEQLPDIHQRALRAIAEMPDLASQDPSEDFCRLLRAYGVPAHDPVQFRQWVGLSSPASTE